MEWKKTSSRSEGVEREPYEPPRIVYREPLETVALICTPPPGKGDPFVCSGGPISS